MKKILSCLVALAMVLSLFECSALAAYELFMDFTGDADGARWGNATNNSATFSVTAVEGNNALCVNKTATSSATYLISASSDTISSGIAVLETKMRADTATSTSYFILTDANNKIVNQFGFYNGKIAYQASDTVTNVGSYGANTWYTIKLVLDMDDKFLDMYVNDKRVASNIPFREAVKIEKLRVGIFKSAKGKTYYDDISLKEVTDGEYSPVTTNIYTSVGVAPQLPSTVSITNSYALTKKEGVTWDGVEQSAYAQCGSFTVSGKTASGKVATAAVTVVDPASPDVYMSDFETDDLSQWTKSGNAPFSTAKVDGENSAAVIGKSTDAFCATKMFPTELGLNYSRVTIEGKMRVDNKSADAYIAVVNAAGGTIARIEAYDVYGTICVRNHGRQSTLGYYGFDGYSADTWYDVKLVFNPYLERYHVYVNGKMLMANLAYSAVNTTIAGVCIGTSDASKGSEYFDDICVMTTSLPHAYVAPALTLEATVGEEVTLPDLVSATYDDEFIDTWNVQWQGGAAKLCDSVGTFTYSGTATSFGAHSEAKSVSATVTVRSDATVALYVDGTLGSDTNDGKTAQSAFKTITAAQNAVRAINDNMTSDIYVYLADGTYSLSEPIVFTEEDSGSNGFYVHYAAISGATPVISGGKEVTGWSKVSGKNYYSAPVSTLDGFADNFRQLYVNGARATRASSGWIKGGEFTKDGDTFTGIKFSSDLLKNYTNIEDVRLTHVNSFKFDELHLGGFVDNGDGTTTALCGSESDGLFSWRADTRWFQATDKMMITNAFEELDAEGEWYLDRTNDTVYYYPYKGEDMTTAQSFVPVMNTDQLVRFEGKTGSPVRNVTIEGLTLMYSNWLYPLTYSVGGSQAEALWGTEGSVTDLTYGYEIPGAVRLNHTYGIKILGNTIMHTAGCGIHVYNDTENTTIEGNLTYDTTGAGIAVGRFGGAFLNDFRNAQEVDKFEGTNMEDRVRDTYVRNNYVRDTGRDFLTATGISLMAAKRTYVTNNLVINAAYMGIHSRMQTSGNYLSRNSSTTPGYQTPVTDTTTGVGQSIIAYNKLGEANWAKKYGINDNAAIYNFGPAAGSMIYRNYIGAHSADSAIYNDDNSFNITWRENVITQKGTNMSTRCVDQRTINLTSNYCASGYSTSNCISTNNSKDINCAAAVAVTNAAGLDAAHTYLEDKIPSNFPADYIALKSLANTEGIAIEGAMPSCYQLSDSYDLGTSNNSETEIMEFDVVARYNNIDAAIEYTNNETTIPSASWRTCGIVFRLNTSGFFDGIDGDTFKSTTFPYEKNTTYHAKIVANLKNATYSVYLNKYGEAPVLAISDYHFRTGTVAINNIGRLAVTGGSGAPAKQFYLLNHMVYSPMPCVVTSITKEATQTGIKLGADFSSETDGNAMVFLALYDAGTLQGVVVKKASLSASAQHFDAEFANIASYLNPRAKIFVWDEECRPQSPLYEVNLLA